MSEGSLTLNVYVTPARPYVGGPRQGPGDDATWAPMSSRLIAGKDEAVLVDALLTNDQADGLAAWTHEFGKRITGVYITHSYSDHWRGLARLQEHFPQARGFATAEVAGRARFEATNQAMTDFWAARFPGELADPVLPDVVEDSEFTIEGHPVRIVAIGQGDTEHSTFLHVPSLGAVIAGDIVYNGVHMMTAETDEGAREEWIASIDAVASLDPKIVVAGHKTVGAPDGPEHLAASKQYLRDFGRLANERERAADIVAGMQELHGDRGKPAHSLDVGTSRRRQTHLNELLPTGDRTRWCGDVSGFGTGCRGFRRGLSKREPINRESRRASPWRCAKGVHQRVSRR